MDDRNFNVILTTDLSEAAALTAMGCPLHQPCAGGKFIKAGMKKPMKAFYFEKNVRTQRLMWFYKNEQPKQDEQQFTEAEEKTIMRLFKHADLNRKEMLLHINKGKDLALIRTGGDGWKLTPCVIKEAADES